MALPKIEPLSSEFEVSKNDSNAVKVEIEKLGKAIFEKTNKSYVKPASLEWNDLGTYNALWEVSNKDKNKIFIG